jgi:hypothetical protein
MRAASPAVRPPAPPSAPGLSFHRTLGVTLASSHPIPGLRPVAPGPASVRVVWHGDEERAWPPLRGRPWRVHPWRDETGRPVLAIHRDAEGGYRLRYADDVRFRVRGDGSVIEVGWPPAYDLADAAAYLVGPVLGFARRLQGATTLHAAAAVIEGRAVALLGASGAGKSTLAWALARRGHRVLCDDAACLDLGAEAVRIEPGSTRVRLWDDAAEALLGDARRAPRLCASWDKRGVDLVADADRYAETSAPLAALLVLDASPAPGAPALSPPLPPAEALIELIGHGYGALLQDGAMRAAEFARLARVAAAAPVRRLRRGARGLADLDAVCAAVERAARAERGDAGRGRAEPRDAA